MTSKLNKICKHAVKRLPCLLQNVPDQYKTQQMCDKTNTENGGILKSVPVCYKNQRMCGKTVDYYPHAFVSE